MAGRERLEAAGTEPAGHFNQDRDLRALSSGSHSSVAG